MNPLGWNLIMKPNKSDELKGKQSGKHPHYTEMEIHNFTLLSKSLPKSYQEMYSIIEVFWNTGFRFWCIKTTTLDIILAVYSNSNLI